MKGEVVGFQAEQDLAVIRTEEGTHSLVELLEGGCRIGDQVSWKGKNPTGWGMVKNLTRRSAVAAFFQSHGLADFDLSSLDSMPLSMIDVDR